MGKIISFDYIRTISIILIVLAHCCFGKYSLYQIIPNPILGTIAIFTISIILAALLHYISNSIKDIITYMRQRMSAPAK